MHYRGNGLPERKPEYRLGVIGICIALFACVFAAWGQDGQDEVYPAITRYDVWHSHKRHFGNDWWCEGGKWEQTEVPVSEDLESGVLDRLHGARGNWHIHYDGWDKNRKLTGDLPEKHNPDRSGGYDCSDYVAPVTSPTTTTTPTTTTSISPTPTPTTITSTGSDSHFYDFSEGDSRFIGLPVLSWGVETVKDLWEVFRAEFKNDISFQLMVNGVWQTSYRGEDNELGETAVTPHLAVNVGIDSWVTIRGEPIAGEEIELAPGVHFVGLPEIPVAYKRPSDLLGDSIAWVHVKKDGKYLYIYAEGDDGDDLFYAGQAFVIRVVETLTLDLRGNEVAAAPMAQRIGTLATSWGAMKQ